VRRSPPLVALQSSFRFHQQAFKSLIPCSFIFQQMPKGLVLRVHGPGLAFTYPLYLRVQGRTPVSGMTWRWRRSFVSWESWKEAGWS